MDALSDRICTSLQIINHLQDVREDLLERDRVYLPREDLKECRVSVDDLRAPHALAGLRRVVRAGPTARPRAFTKTGS